MKLSSGPCTTASDQSKPVRWHFHKHALSATLVVCLVALASPAEAKVVHTRVNVTISGNGSIALDLNHDGITDFTIVAVGRALICAGTGKGEFGYVTVSPAQEGAGMVSAWPGSSWAAVLGKGVEIDSSQSFYDTQAIMTEFTTCLWPPHGPPEGDWEEVTNRFLGLVFSIDGATHYGWARVSVHPATDGTVITLTDFAYETIPDQAIKTGQTSDGAASEGRSTRQLF